MNNINIQINQINYAHSDNSILKQMCDRITDIEQGSSRLYTMVYNMYEDFIKPAGAAMPAIAEVLKSKRKIKAATDPDYKERGWKSPFADWIIVLDQKAGAECMLKDMTRTEVAETIMKKHEMAWKPPV